MKIITINHQERVKSGWITVEIKLTLPDKQTLSDYNPILDLAYRVRNKIINTLVKEQHDPAPY